MDNRIRLVSVILPVFNAADHVEQQLRALGKQTYKGNWELVVADNGSTDATRSIVEAWCARIPNMVVIDGDRPGGGAARNVAAQAARGDMFAFCDADDIVSPAWLEACAAAARDHDLVAGGLEHFGPQGAPIPWKADAARMPTTILNLAPFATGANMAVSRRAFESVGGFAEDLPAGEDADLTWRLQLSGYELYFQPAAVVAKRARRTLREEWQQAETWGVADVELERRHGRSGLKRNTMLGALRHALGHAAADPRLAASMLGLRHRRFWVAGIARRWGRLKASVRPTGRSGSQYGRDLSER